MRLRAGFIALVVVGAIPGAARAATLTVTTSGESAAGDGQCSLREAVATINAFGQETDCGTADSSGNTIVLGPHAYVLATQATQTDDNSTGDLDFTAAITTTIQGAGVGVTSISGAGFPVNNPDRLFHVIAGSVVMRGLTLTKGVAPSGADGEDGTFIPGAFDSPPVAGATGFSGGAILNGATLELDDVDVTDNTAGSGGKGGNGDQIDGAAIAGDAGVGGGIANFGTLTLRDVTFNHNAAGSGGKGGNGDGYSQDGAHGGCCGDGGGLYSGSGTVHVIGSTFTDNHAGAGGSGGVGGPGQTSASVAGNGGSGEGGGSGGGIALTGGSLTMTNSTIASNFSGIGGNGGNGGFNGDAQGKGGDAGNGSTGGGLFVRGGASATLLNVTIASNQVGAPGIPGIAQIAGAATGLPGSAPFGGGVSTSGTPAPVLQDTLLAANGLGNCGGTLPSGGGRDQSFGDGSCPLGFTASDPVLGPLQDNGGPTETMALGTGSAAIDAGAGCDALDQRGLARPSGAACDIGAYEVALPALTVLPAGAVTSSGATLSGSATANQVSATVHFEFGTTAEYGQTAAAGSVSGLSPQPVTVVLTGLRPNTTFHYRLVASSPDGTARSSDATFTTPSAPATVGTAPRAPQVSGLAITPRRFRTRPAHGKPSGRTGTTITYTDSGAAATTLVISRVQTGVRQHRRCVTRRAHARGNRCTLVVKVLTLRRSDRAGTNRVSFDRHLVPGNYRLAVIPRAAGLTGATRTMMFTVKS